MSYLREELERLSFMTVSVDAPSDEEVSGFTRKHVIDAIRNDNENNVDFVNQIEKHPNNTFSFGDKFFAPASNGLICIPLHLKGKKAIVLSQLKKLGVNERDVRECIYSAFKKMWARMETSGYFGI